MSEKVWCVSRNTHRQSKLMHKFQDMGRQAMLAARPASPSDALLLAYEFIELADMDLSVRPSAWRWCQDRVRGLEFVSRTGGLHVFRCRDGSEFGFNERAYTVWASPPPHSP